MEESKQTVESVKKNLDKLRKEIKHNKLPVMDFLLSSVRNGKNDYDFENSKIICEDLYWDICEIPSHIDGKAYVCKIYNLNKIRSQRDKILITWTHSEIFLKKFEQEISLLLSLKHQFIIQVVDVMKDR